MLWNENGLSFRLHEVGNPKCNILQQHLHVRLLLPLAAKVKRMLDKYLGHNIPSQNATTDKKKGEIYR